MARATGTYNVLLEFLEYDRSIVLGAPGDTVGARAGYRSYLQLVGAALIPAFAVLRAPFHTPDDAAVTKCGNFSDRIRLW